VKTIAPVLVVEDSRTMASMIIRSLEDSGFCALHAASMAAAKELLEKHTFMCALLDLNLPDAPKGEVVDYVLSLHIPAIVLTGMFDEKTRQRMVVKPIIDYVLKETAEDIEYAVQMVRRLSLNPSIKVLVVDDSTMFRKTIVEMLKIHLFTVFAVKSAEEGLEILKTHPDIKLVFTDYNMPGMDGMAFTRLVRKQFPKEKLGIIAMSSKNSDVAAAKFLKNGANEFLIKPFSKELFYNRVNLVLEMLELLEKTRKLSEEDYLTKLYNRRYFYSRMDEELTDERLFRGNYAFAMMDIDHFKNINDTHGHATGDLVLKQTARLLKECTEGLGIVSRFGGEEFCAFLDVDAQTAYKVMEYFRTTLETTEMVSDIGKRFYVTISIGLNADPSDEIELALSQADELLYQAKHSGRNRVISNPPIIP